MGNVLKICEQKFNEAKRRKVTSAPSSAGSVWCWLVDPSTGRQTHLVRMKNGDYLFSLDVDGNAEAGEVWIAGSTREGRYRPNPKLSDTIDANEVKILERSYPMPYASAPIWGVWDKAKKRLMAIVRLKEVNNVVTSDSWTTVPGELKTLKLIRESRGFTYIDPLVWWRLVDAGKITDIYARVKSAEPNVRSVYDGYYIVIQNSWNGWGEPRVYRRDGLPPVTVENALAQKKYVNVTKR